MAAIAVDSAWNGELKPATAISVAALGMVLALRVTQLLFATRTLSAERIELYQSNALIELSRALSGTNDLQETLDLVTRWAVRLLGGRGAAIELLSPDGKLLEIRAIDSLSEELLQMRFPVDGCFTGWVVRNGKPRNAADPHTDPYMSSVSLQYLGNSPVAAVPLRYRDETLGVLWCISDYPLDATELALLGALAEQAAVAIENARLFHEVHILSLTDPLTGMPNRRQLEKDLYREFAAARRGRRLVVVMFDLNGFKQYNDRYGHLAGDEAIRMFANALTAEMRTMNMAGRYGGDEFTAVLADADRVGAEVFIERVRHRFPGPNATLRENELGVAAGLAEYVPEMASPDELLAAADAALYREKQQRKDEQQAVRQSASA
jgi:diguanylate cyclase (GGDEF)-like protein